MKKTIKDILLSLVKVAVLMLGVLLIINFASPSNPHWEVLNEKNENGWRLKITQLSTHIQGQTILTRREKTSDFLIEVYQGGDIQAKASIRKEDLTSSDDDQIEVVWNDNGFTIQVNKSPKLKFENQTIGQIMFFEMN